MGVNIVGHSVQHPATVTVKADENRSGLCGETVNRDCAGDYCRGRYGLDCVIYDPWCLGSGTEFRLHIQEHVLLRVASALGLSDVPQSTALGAG